MALQTFNNGESLGSIRNKLNNTTIEADKVITKSYDYVATPDQASGNVTAQTANSITDNTKSWATNQFAGSVVRLVTSGGVEDAAIVLSNTATQLTFDANHAGYTFASYRILSTFTAPDINAIYSFDVLTNDCGFVLPAVATLENRKFIRAYIEKATGDTRKVYIVCTGADRQRGRKFGFLENIYEGVEFWTHKVTPNHWDILAFDNIKRYSNIAVTTNQAINTTGYTANLPFASVSSDTLRRFDLIDVGGVAWLKYQSISTLDFHASGSLIITRSGGGSSTVDVTIRIKRFNGGAIVDATRFARAKFSGDSTQTAALDINITLEPFDEITIITKRDAGTVTLEAGSNIVFTEM